MCDEVRMMDKDTNEELIFTVKRWLARDEDDHEICRELPVVRRGDPNLPGKSSQPYKSCVCVWMTVSDMREEA